MDKPEYGFWMLGIIQDQDDLVHEIFSGQIGRSTAKSSGTAST